VSPRTSDGRPAGQGLALAPTVHDLSRLRAERAVPGSTTGVVMTMGALHEGHATLVRAARARVGAEGLVVVTVFVNPLQVGAGEDLDRYPRTLEADLAVAEAAGADLVFAPSAEEVYPGGEPQVRLSAGPMGGRLEGAVRPGHFDGMLTVVAKLLHLTRPDVAVFGQKDYQQLVLVTRMSRDLDLRVEVVGAETVREPDGLALSSRNRYLGEAERGRAATLSRALRAAQDRAAYGLPAARWAAMRVLDEVPESELELDYLAIRTPELAEVLEEHPVDPVPARILVAARVGSTRLIDNLPLTLGSTTPAAASSASRAR
jgi:pantoate--beta-alanine ligase